MPSIKKFFDKMFHGGATDQEEEQRKSDPDAKHFSKTSVKDFDAPAWSKGGIKSDGVSSKMKKFMHGGAVDEDD
jgi:hypothetical protein